ncbi:MAG TPA: hypothetical protein VFM17_01860 [Candidatus Eisenbacteria bacterium]|nr:hypothetical protein [Candidatus Eisenbacteria bacterium]
MAYRATKRPRGAGRPLGGLFVFGALLGAAWLGASAAPGTARGQVFNIQGGTSSLYHATGGTVSVRGEGFDGWLGLGDLERFRVGGLFRKDWNGGLLSVGDQAVPFGLPTDVFQAPHAFYGRGFGFEREIGDVRLRAIGGSTATVYGSPFFLGARSERGAGILFLDHDVSPTVRVLTRSVFTRRQTVISGLEWTPRSDLATALAAGGGDGEPYGAASVRFERPWITARAAWSAASDGFRRVAVPQASASEMERENLDLKIRPIRPLVVQLGRYHFLQPETETTPALRGRVHQALLNAKALGATSTVGYYDSRAGASGNTGFSIGLTRPVGRAFEVGGNYLRAEDRSGQRFETFVGTLRENVSPHVDLTQVVTHTEGNTTISFGGSYVASRFSVGAEWQTVYVPFGTGDPFRQALMLTVRILAFGDFTANLGSYVAPDGSVKYTLAGNQYLYRGAEGSSHATKRSLSDHLVHGLVTDEKGEPVRGAAVKVDGEVVYTDSDGYFFVRKPKGRRCAIEVAPGEFLTPLPYVVVSAPEFVESQPEGRGAGAVIVVRRIIPGTPKPQAKDWTGVEPK